MSKKQFARVVAILYLAALLAAAGLCGVRAKARKTCTEQTLTAADAQWSSIRDNHPVAWAGYDAESLVTTDTDGYLVWNIDGPVSGLRMRVRSSQPIRDPALYYTTAEGQDYQSGKTFALVESIPEQGVYVFALPGATKVHQLRLDPTSSAGAFFELEEVTLNPAGLKNGLQTSEWLFVLVAPLLAALALQEVISLFRKEKDWKELE